MREMRTARFRSEIEAVEKARKSSAEGSAMFAKRRELAGLKMSGIERLRKQQIAEIDALVEARKKNRPRKPQTPAMVADYVLDRAATVARRGGPKASLMPHYAESLRLEKLPPWLGGTDVDLSPNDSSSKQPWIWQRGSGNGWSYGDIAQPVTMYVDFFFIYSPPESRTYNLTAKIVIRGVCTAIADDQAWNSLYAAAATGPHALYFWQSDEPAGQGFISSADTWAFGFGDDNIDVRDARLDVDQDLQGSVFLEAVHLVIFTVSVALTVYARGDGTFAEVSCDRSPSDFVACPLLHVD